MEIYNEDVRDLLVCSNKGASAASQALEVKERADIGVYVKDLTSVTVSSADHMFKLMQFGNSNRNFFIDKNDSIIVKSTCDD